MKLFSGLFWGILNLSWEEIQQTQTVMVPLWFLTSSHFLSALFSCPILSWTRSNEGKIFLKRPHLKGRSDLGSAKTKLSCVFNETCMWSCNLCVLQVMPALFWLCSPSTWCPAVRGPPPSATSSALCSTPSMATPPGRLTRVRMSTSGDFLWPLPSPCRWRSEYKKHSVHLHDAGKRLIIALAWMNLDFNLI